MPPGHTLKLTLTLILSQWADQSSVLPREQMHARAHAHTHTHTQIHPHALPHAIILTDAHSHTHAISQAH